MTQVRSPQSPNLLKSVNVANCHECRAREEVSNMQRSRVLLVVRAVTWCGVVAMMQRHLVEIRAGKQRISNAHPSVSHTTTLSTPTARSTVPSVCFFGLQQENNLEHHGWPSHDYADPDTKT